ncbi:MAG: DUF6036 family nucleotidyltransferase [Oscillospiraceae bacterium]|nr:DUF6036 family nucleotidyltransferase [Oscillospiraceae bacterium]
MTAMSFDDVLLRLNRLDEDVYLSFDTDKRYYLIIVGGSALILHKLRTIATHDIDSIGVSKELYPLLEKHDINTRAQAYINCFPYNYEDRLKLVFQGRKIDVYVVSLEDAVIAKLYASRPVDIVDITDSNVLMNLDWDKLEFLATDESEAWSSRLNDNSYNIFLDAYKDYVREFKL